MPNKIPVVFHNGSSYDYYFIIKESANEFADLRDNLNVLGKIKKTKELFVFQ